jgi:hypothetical protein
MMTTKNNKPLLNKLRLALASNIDIYSTLDNKLLQQNNEQNKRKDNRAISSTRAYH